MVLIFAAIAGGLVVGWLDLLNYKQRHYLSYVATAALFVMLACLGAKIGCNEEMLHNFSKLGYLSVVLTAGVILGSLCCLWLLVRVFPREEELPAENGGSE